MDTVKFEASLLKSLEGIQEAVAVLKEGMADEAVAVGSGHPVVTSSQPIGRVPDGNGVQLPASDYVDQTSIQIGGEDILTAEEKDLEHRRMLHSAMYQGYMALGDKWDRRLTRGNERDIAINVMRNFSDGTPARARGLAHLINAMVQWHDAIPTLGKFERAVTEMDSLHADSPWHLQGLDHGLFDGPAKAVFWRGNDYATLHAAEYDGATYETEGEADSLKTARMYAAAVSEVWGHENGKGIAVAFIK